MRNNRSFLVLLLAIFCFLPLVAQAQDASFDFKRYLFGTPPALSLSIDSLDPATGTVRINGVDTQGPATPFTWMWGDGSLTSGFFPQLHTYSEKNKNYVIKVISTYSQGAKDSADIAVWFVPPRIVPVPLSSVIGVHIPESPIPLATRLYDPPSNLIPFDSSFFSTLPRATLEYVLSVAATLQRGFVNDTTYLFNGTFEQYMFRDSSFGGAYSLWFTDPVSFAVGDAFLTGGIDYSSLFHEMGHNFTLNTPAGYYYGGKIDGDANAIFSESMAQIFQHATGYEIVNQHQGYGVDDALTCAIKQQAIRTVSMLRACYDDYVKAGKPFASWNEPSTPSDETFGTFMAIAYKFCAHAESAGGGYRAPLKRMMQLLEGFCPNWAESYDRLHNTASADTFRSTLMVSALSYAFSTDMRGEFRLLGFPISDEIYEELYNSPTGVGYESRAVPSRSSLLTCFPNPFNPGTTICYALLRKAHVILSVFNTLGQHIAHIVDGEEEAGYHQVSFDGRGLASGVYLYRIQAGDFVETRRSLLLH